LSDSGTVLIALQQYAEQVRGGAFPTPKHCFNE
jgi:ketopantoate hydroxymethyltransferase